MTVIPQGGLCNRLRVVLSALAVSRHGHDVTVEWGSTRECRAAFSELFQSLTAPEKDTAENAAYGTFRIRDRRWWNAPQTRRNLHIPALLRRVVYDLQLVNYRCTHADDFLSRARACNNIYVSTGYDIYPYSPALARLLRPVEALQKQIDALTATFDEHTVGVHIRRTDNAQSRSHSTDEAFIAAMQQAVIEDNATHFFVATDEPRLLDVLKEKYPGRIMHQQLSDVRRDTTDGMRQAVIDLFCLARTHHLLGSYWSSFTDMAAEIGEQPVHIIGAPE